MVGKGISRFHAVHWPAMLLVGRAAAADALLVHGYLTVDGRKIGKSLGNAVDPAALAARYGAGTSSATTCCAHIRPFADGDFSEARLRAARDAELADQLGNLVRRTVTLLQRHSGTGGPGPAPAEPAELALQRAGRARCRPGSTRRSPRFAADEALAAVFDLVAATNRYLERTAPWKRTGDPARLATVLGRATRAEADASPPSPWLRSCPGPPRPSWASWAMRRPPPVAGPRRSPGGARPTVRRWRRRPGDRCSSPRADARADDLTAAMVGIGMNFAATGAAEPNIEDTLLFAPSRRWRRMISAYSRSWSPGLVFTRPG